MQVIIMQVCPDGVSVAKSGQSGLTIRIKKFKNIFFVSHWGRLDFCSLVGDSICFVLLVCFTHRETRAVKVDAVTG